MPFINLLSVISAKQTDLLTAIGQRDALNPFTYYNYTTKITKNKQNTAQLYQVITR